jgi:hypothetical protein
MVKAGGGFDVLAHPAAMAMLLWWSVDQVRHGTTKYRKIIGAVTLVGALSRTVQAEHARARFGTYEGCREPANTPVPDSAVQGNRTEARIAA